MRRELRSDEIIVNLPNENYPILVRLNNNEGLSFKKDKHIGDSVFFWMNETYCSVDSENWMKIKEWSRNNKIKNILE